MKPRKRHLTSRIAPKTKHALMAQLAAAADEIMAERQRSSELTECWHTALRESSENYYLAKKLGLCLSAAKRRWWHRLMWWRK